MKLQHYVRTLKVTYTQYVPLGNKQNATGDHTRLDITSRDSFKLHTKPNTKL